MIICSPALKVSWSLDSLGSEGVKSKTATASISIMIRLSLVKNLKEEEKIIYRFNPLWLVESKDVTIANCVV